ncbi:glycosyltransferase family 2 protein [Aquimarina pacifica]|uniref:glycosyltransferase family 2 protein n=1 Tax=Aquimarina pacifica TaxID=1296415 RepID=UPI000470A283|nr:glycosyltransferase family 2 protein [Aquimarina pacifica]
MNIAIVILNWNGRSLLEEFLPSVTEYSKEAIVYVADNASTDTSISYVRKHFPEVKIVVNKSNGGYAKGYNDALSKIDADIYCLLNSDVEVTKNWLVPIQNAFLGSNRIAAIQPKILDYKKKTHFEYAGAAGGYIDRLGYPYCRGRLFETIEEDTGQYNDSVPIFWASGACLFIRKVIFEEAGKFDEDFFAHQEEIDLCWRIHNLGYSIHYIGESVVYHLGGATLNAMNPKKTFLNFRNSLFMLLKNAPGNSLWFLIPIRMTLDGLAATRFIVQGKTSHFSAIFKAHMSFYANFVNFVKKRQKLSKTGKYYSFFSVVWQYFIKKNKHFNQL